MTYQLNPILWNGVFAVPNCVVDEHLRLCSGLALKVLLWILRHPGEDNSPSALAEALRQAQGDITDALNYWEEHNVLQPFGAAPAQANAVVQEVSAPAKAQDSPPRPKAKALVSSIGRPHYPREEAVALIESNDSLKSLIDEGQSIMGKAFTSADIDTVVALSSYYGLSLFFIITVMHYCVEYEQRSLGRVESICVAWLNDGVTDENIDAYVEQLKKRRSNEGLVRRAFGIGERRLTTKEKDLISGWFETLHMPLEMISLAYEKAVESTGKLSFSYIDKILTAWSKKQIDTVEKAKQESAEFTEKTARKKKSNDRREERDAEMERLVKEFMNSSKKTTDTVETAKQN